MKTNKNDILFGIISGIIIAVEISIYEFFYGTLSKMTEIIILTIGIVFSQFLKDIIIYSLKNHKK